MSTISKIPSMLRFCICLQFRRYRAPFYVERGLKAKSMGYLKLRKSYSIRFGVIDSILLEPAVSEIFHFEPHVGAFQIKISLVTLTFQCSSVAHRGSGGFRGGCIPPTSLNITCILRMYNIKLTYLKKSSQWTLDRPCDCDLISKANGVGGGGGRKMLFKNAYWKMLSTGIIKNIYALEHGRGAIQYYSSAINYQSLLSNVLPLPLPPIYIFIKYRLNR